MPAASFPPLRRVDLAQLLRQAADGRFPEADGGFSRAVPWRPGVEAAVAFTGHAVMVLDQAVTDEQLLGLGAHGYGGAHDPRVAVALAGEGEIGVLDALLVGRGRGGSAEQLVDRPELARTERARHAAGWRDDVRVLGLPRGSSSSLATLSRGVAGLPEVGLEAEDGEAGSLLAGVLGSLPAGEVVIASVTPGNARSLRFFLRHGFTPVGSVQLWRPRR